MIRQRFGSGRLARIGAWALAAVTSVTALVNHQAGAIGDLAGTSPGADGPPFGELMAAGTAALPAAPAGGLLILRYEPSSQPAPPAADRRVTVGQAPAASSTQRVTRGPAPAASAAPAPALPPPPAALPAPPPVQSSGS